ncbi:MAG: asparaginase domain-containing protein, partial [Actinomycetota bacterium]|nr:asparaginase domain-containing protein [Actinomycetota bacterium]
LRGGAQGVVVTQGTDTIEETSYCLDLLVRARGRVVVTGAMRNPTLPGADGPANLHAAVVLAAGREDLEGVVVVLNDEVHSARTVRKQHSTLPSAFGSPGAGPLGIVAERSFVRMRRTAEPRVTLSRRMGMAATPWVPVVSVGLGDDGRLLDAVRGADALVVEAFGAGHVPSILAESLGQLARQIPVVMVSKTGDGPVLRETYGFEGSERDLRARGVLSAGLLAAAKVRLLLLLALRSGADRPAVEALLAQVEDRAPDGER